MMWSAVSDRGVSEASKVSFSRPVQSLNIDEPSWVMVPGTVNSFSFTQPAKSDVVYFVTAGDIVTEVSWSQSWKAPLPRVVTVSGITSDVMGMPLKPVERSSRV